MIGHGVDTVEFHEPGLQGAPACVPEVAALCWVGYRLVRPPTPALENLVIGKQRLPQFRDAKRSELRRVVRWHFISRYLTWHGGEMTPARWLDLWRSDAALRRMVEETPAYGRWVDVIAATVAAAPLVAMAEEASRFCYGQFGGDPLILRAMHGYMEGEAEI